MVTVDFRFCLNCEWRKSCKIENWETLGWIALAWLLAQKPWFVPIPGTTKLHRLEGNLGGASVALTADDLKAIHDAVSAIDVQGDRYPASYQTLVNR